MGYEVWQGGQNKGSRTEVNFRLDPIAQKPCGAPKRAMARKIRKGRKIATMHTRSILHPTQIIFIPPTNVRPTASEMPGFCLPRRGHLRTSQFDPSISRLGGTWIGVSAACCGRAGRNVRSEAISLVDELRDSRRLLSARHVRVAPRTAQGKVAVPTYSSSIVKRTSFISLISVITIACVPVRSKTIPLARTYLPTNGINFCR